MSTFHRLWLDIPTLVRMLGALQQRGSCTRPKRMLWPHAMSLVSKLPFSMGAEGVLVGVVAQHTLPFNRSLLVLLWYVFCTTFIFCLFFSIESNTNVPPTSFALSAFKVKVMSGQVRVGNLFMFGLK